TPLAAAIFAFNFAPPLSKFLRARSPLGFFTRRVRRAGTRFALRISFAFLGGLRRRKPLQCGGHAAHKFGYAFAGSRGDGVESELALRAMLAQPFQPRTVRGGVEFRRHHDHRLCPERPAERSELATDNFKIANGIAVRSVARIHQMGQQASSFDVAQKSRAQPNTLICAFDEPGQISHDKRPPKISMRAARSDSVRSRPREFPRDHA